MKIRTMKEADISAALYIDRSAFGKPWREKDFSDELSKAHSHYFIADTEDGAVGYIGIWCIYETADLVRIAVSPRVRRQGIGGGLVMAALDAAKRHGCEKMMLEVRESNIEARRLYEKSGFSQISVRRGYYDGEDALIMQRYI